MIIFLRSLLLIYLFIYDANFLLFLKLFSFLVKGMAYHIFISLWYYDINDMVKSFQYLWMYCMALFCNLPPSCVDYLGWSWSNKSFRYFAAEIFSVRALTSPVVGRSGPYSTVVENCSVWTRSAPLLSKLELLSKLVHKHW